MHFVLSSPPLLPRKHLNPLKTPNARAVCFSNAHPPQHFFLSGSPRLPKKNPLKTACGDKLLPELIHLVERHMYCNFYTFFPFPNMVLSHSLLSHLMGTAFTFCHYCTLWFNSPGSRGGRTEVKAAWKADTHCELFKFILSCDMIAAAWLWPYNATAGEMKNTCAAQHNYIC